MDLMGAANAVNSVFGPKSQQANKAARNQALPFMFEVSGGGKEPERFILPLPPESLRVSWSTKTHVTHTKAGAFQDNNGLGLPSFAFQGTFGYRGTLDKGNAAKSLTGEVKSAYDLTRDLEFMLLQFYSRFGTYLLNGWVNPNPVDPTNLPVLSFYNFTDRDFYEVQINKFDLLRNTQRRFLYQYDIQMTGIRRVAAPMSEDALAARLNSLAGIDNVTGLMGFVSGALALYTAVSGAITSVINTIDRIKDQIHKVVAAVKAFRNGITKLIKAGASLVINIVKAVDSIIDTLVSFKEIPHEILHACREIKRAFMPLANSPHLCDETPDRGTIIIPPWPSQEILTGALPQNGAAAAYQMDTPEDTMFAPGSEIVREVSVRDVPVTDSDTIYSIAQQNGVDWQQLASLNGLEYPFVAKTRWDMFTPALEIGGTAKPIRAEDITIQVVRLQPQAGEILLFTEPGTADLDVVSGIVSSVEGDLITLEEAVGADFTESVMISRHEATVHVLKPGGKVLIPGSTQGITAIASGPAIGDTYSQLYGVDEELDEEGGQSPEASGDLRSIAGLGNLEMQLRHRLLTMRGELAQIGHPEYGSLLPTLIGQMNIPVMQERALLEAELTILADPRIERLENATFLVDGTALYFEADVYPVQQQNATRISLPLAA